MPDQPPRPPLSSARIAEIRQRLQAATPGPWESHACFDSTGYPVYSLHGVSGDGKRDYDQHVRNAHLIADAPQAIADLLAELDRRDTLVNTPKVRVLAEQLDAISEAPDGASLARQAGPVTAAARKAADLIDALLAGSRADTEE